jgi:hypothetical protein
MTTKTKQRSAAEIRRIIDQAWSPLARAAQAYDAFEKAFAAELTAEKEHRAFGARFTRGLARYRLPAHYAAKLLVLQHTFKASAVPRTWRDFTGYTRRIALAQALREWLIENGAFTHAFGEPKSWRDTAGCARSSPRFMSLDYATDIAVPFGESQ